jgi:hypothetical protein
LVSVAGLPAIVRELKGIGVDCPICHRQGTASIRNAHTTRWYLHCHHCHGKTLSNKIEVWHIVAAVAPDDVERLLGPDPNPESWERVMQEMERIRAKERPLPPPDPAERRDGLL